MSSRTRKAVAKTKPNDEPWIRQQRAERELAQAMQRIAEKHGVVFAFATETSVKIVAQELQQ